ncbi:DUF971 domain-containing protein [uncultured Thiodictyon sp.]|jgi:DUF971 family protein|uniref:DUF971 domain-containing protein n=1 Tax=uncultured Thiodictyon sp. TaxID=1846217 RepID=UPI0025FC5F78|nr:DUF971 domain-containing protein [uncultured Thiodictyon sp.]
METRHLPTEINLHQRSRVLEITFDDGARCRLPCEYLRVASPSAAVRGHSAQTARLQVGKEQVGITRLEQVGAYALKVYFDDGHNSGLYDWQYLYQLGRDWPTRWQDYLRRLAAVGHQREGLDPFDDLLARGESPSELPSTAAI